MYRIVKSMLVLIVILYQQAFAEIPKLIEPEEGLLGDSPKIYQWYTEPAQKYQFILRDATSKEVLLNKRTTNTNISFPSFQYDLTKKYQWKVRGKFSGKWDQYSPWQNFYFNQLPVLPPSKPIQDNSTYNTLHWFEVDGASTYQVVIKNFDSNTVVKRKRVNALSLTLTDENLFTGNLRWKVRAKNAAGWSKFSTWQQKPSLTISPSISIHSPVDGQYVQISGPVIGSYGSGDIRGVKLSHGDNDRPACLYNSNFYLNSYPFDNEFNGPLTASLSNLNGVIATDSQDIILGSGSLRVSVDNDCDAWPFVATFKVINNETASLVSVDLDSDGVIDQSFSHPIYEYKVDYNASGVFTPIFHFSDNTSEQLYIVSKSLEELEGEVTPSVDAFYEMMAENNSEELQFVFSSESRAKYENLLSSQNIGLDALISELSTASFLSSNGDQTEFAVNRTIEGVNRAFFMTLVRDIDGVWRIQSF